MLGARSYKYSGGSNAVEKLCKAQNLALKDSSSFDSPSYDCVPFITLIKLNGESFAAKNLLFMSLVKVNSGNFALKDYSSFDSPRNDCVLFMSLIKVNGECFAA